MLSLVNNTPYKLGASLWVCDLLQAENLAAQIDIGMVFINETARSDVRLTFERVKTQVMAGNSRF